MTELRAWLATPEKAQPTQRNVLYVKLVLAGLAGRAPEADIYPGPTDISGRLSDVDDAVIPSPRTERQVAIRELRNAGKVVSELARAGAIGRVTSGGRLVGWLVPATPAEQRAQELTDEGRLRPGRPGGLAGRRPLPRRGDVPPLGETLKELRRGEQR